MRTGARRAVIVTALPLLVLVGGTALAAWVSSGPGNASSKASVAKPPTTSTSATALTTGLLYPGGTGDAVLTVNNPNPYPVALSSLVTTGAATVSAAGSGTCATTGVTITATTPSSTTVPANGSATLTLSGAAAMSNASDNGCQGATFTVPVTVSITSAS